MYSDIVAKRRAGAVLCVHPVTAQKLALLEGKTYQIELKNESYQLGIRLDESVPEGVGLLPRSVGVPLASAQALDCR